MEFGNNIGAEPLYCRGITGKCTVIINSAEPLLPLAMRRNNRRPERTDPKTKWCFRCDRNTTHLFDHGENMYVCSECEVN